MSCSLCSGDRLDVDGACEDCRDECNIPKQANAKNFASHLTSPTFCVVLGPNKRAYYPHKELLITKIPYFRTLLNGAFQGVEAAHDSVTLDSSVDSEEAFEAVLEYIYLGSYKSVSGSDASAQCLLHARVYVLAERLCMEALKDVALDKMLAELSQPDPASCFGPRSADSTSHFRGSRGKDKKRNRLALVDDELAPPPPPELEPEPVPFPDEPEPKPVSQSMIDVDRLMDIVEIVYANTPDDIDPKARLDEGSSDKARIKNGSGEEVEDEQAEPSACAEPESRTDKMRILVSRYAASRMGEVKTCKGLMALVKANVHLAKDLVLAAAPGKRLQSNELKNL